MRSENLASRQEKPRAGKFGRVHREQSKGSNWADASLRHDARTRRRSNRLIADLREQPSVRLTQTNLSGRYTGGSPSTISGLLGPVRLSVRPIKRP